MFIDMTRLYLLLDAVEPQAYVAHAFILFAANRSTCALGQWLPNWPIRLINASLSRCRQVRHNLDADRYATIEMLTCAPHSRCRQVRHTRGADRCATLAVPTGAPQINKEL